ncbi:MAG: hypothetical protein ABIZ80_05630, partial [Bryobacteraceae bacterium]
SDWPRAERGESGGWYPAILGALLVLFLTSLQWGTAAPEPWPLLLKILAICALPAMFWAASKIH